VPVDVRLIASTNRDLPAEVEAGRFREDLYYRLDVVHLAVPPLRVRRDDIPRLVDHLVQRLNAKLGTAFAGVEPEALRMLVDQPWKGNVRELENVLERAMVLGDGTLVSLEHLAVNLTAPGAPRYADVLAEARFDKREAARRLGISLASLYRKLGAFLRS